ncbi:MAG TPA: hypothetical protein VJ201_01390, partial [Candidatus Babeliales bacterium]|nr:hypothetical protein [Candidatus Babeliales bacterium]
MEYKKITSANNPLIKDLVRLRTDKKERIEKQRVLLANIKTITELAKKLPPVLLLSHDEHILTSLFSQGVQRPEAIFLTTHEIIKKISGLSAPEGIIALFTLPAPKPLTMCKRILVLDGINDPGNLGTL